MTSSLVVVFTSRAAREASDAMSWWQEHRPAAPDLLRRELGSVLDLVAAAPFLGSSARDARLEGVRRVLLRRTRYHVYYRVDPTGARLEVLALWHARRPPPSL